MPPSFGALKKNNFYIFILSLGLDDLSSLSRDWTQAMTGKAPNPNL